MKANNFLKYFSTVFTLGTDYHAVIRIVPKNENHRQFKLCALHPLSTANPVAALPCPGRNSVSRNTMPLVFLYQTPRSS